MAKHYVRMKVEVFVAVAVTSTGKTTGLLNHEFQAAFDEFNRVLRNNFLSHKVDKVTLVESYPLEDGDEDA